MPEFKKDCTYTIDGKDLVYTKRIGLRWYFKSVKGGGSYYVGIDEKLVSNINREYLRKQSKRIQNSK